MEKDNLLPCPFCGGVDLSDVWSGDQLHVMAIRCNSCDAEGPTAKGIDEAFALWNKRGLSCEDCGKPYIEFPLDVVIPDDQWELITGYSDGRGILCAGCIVQRGSRLNGVTVARLVFE